MRRLLFFYKKVTTMNAVTYESVLIESLICPRKTDSCARTRLNVLLPFLNGTRRDQTQLLLDQIPAKTSPLALWNPLLVLSCLSTRERLWSWDEYATTLPSGELTKHCLQQFHRSLNLHNSYSVVVIENPENFSDSL